MAESKFQMPSTSTQLEIFLLPNDRFGQIRNHRVTKFENESTLIDAVCKGICKTDKLRIVIPGSSLGKIHDARISNIPQMDRIIVYCETDAEMKSYQKNSAEHINRKVQYCLTRDLNSILDGTEIRSILYREGSTDTLALKNKLEDIRQRLSRKEKAAKSSSTNISMVPTINQWCSHCEELFNTRTPCEYCLTATSADLLPSTPTGASPKNDYSINDLIATNNIYNST